MVVELENVGKLMVAQVVDLKALECYNCFQGLGFDLKAVLASAVNFEKIYGSPRNSGLEPFQPYVNLNQNFGLAASKFPDWVLNFVMVLIVD